MPDIIEPVKEQVTWGPTICITHLYADGSVEHFDLADPKKPLPRFRSLVKMEPAQGPVEFASQPIKLVYTIRATVQSMRKDPTGWYIQFEGSAESINFGESRPAWNLGDAVKITFERCD